jgi:hypothetical protein
MTLACVCQWPVKCCSKSSFTGCTYTTLWEPLMTALTLWCHLQLPIPFLCLDDGHRCKNLPLLSLRCSPSPWSWTPSLMLHCTPSLSRGCREVTWEGRRIVVAGASRRGFFHLQLSNWLANRERSGVVGFCYVMVEVSSYSGSYGPSPGPWTQFTIYQLFITLNLKKSRLCLHLRKLWTLRNL